MGENTGIKFWFEEESRKGREKAWGVYQLIALSLRSEPSRDTVQEVCPCASPPLASLICAQELQALDLQALLSIREVARLDTVTCPCNTNALKAEAGESSGD